METRLREIKARNFPDISINVIPGHFATRHSHINYYVDLVSVICSSQASQAAAKALVSRYVASTPVESIVCLDGGEVVAAFMAFEMSRKETRSVNAGADIAIVTPELDSSGSCVS